MSHLQDVGMFEDGLRGQGIEIAAASLTRIVDQHIDTAPGVCNFCDKSLDSLTVGHVNRTGNHRLGVFLELHTDFADGCLTAGANRYPGPFSRESPGYCQANAPGSARDDHAFCTQINVHAGSCCFFSAGSLAGFPGERPDSGGCPGY
ncbi:hypothetical protein D3C81_1703490 [compost metagenome]